MQSALSETPPAQAETKELSGPRNLTYPDGNYQTELTSPSLVVPAQVQPASAVPASTGFDYPVGGASYHEGFEMNNCFGCDYLYYYGHTGEDFDNGREGDPIYSVSEGVVVYTGVGPGAWGNVLIIQHVVHGQNIYSQYAHMRSIWVSPGQVVGRRQQVGTVGTTGTSAPHLHLEIKDQPSIGHGYTGAGFSNTNIISAWGITYYAPSWWINNHRYYWDDLPTTEPPPGLHYYWSWYDDLEGKNWMLLGSPSGGNQRSFDINIRGKSPDLSFFGGATVNSGTVATPKFPGLRGGPAVATSLTSEKAIVSQRIVWGASSLEEIPGTEEVQLDDHYYWTWYDQLSPGFKNWILVANPSYSEVVTAEVSFRNLVDGQIKSVAYNIGPGQSVTPTFPGSMGGLVQVKAWVNGGSWYNASDRRPVIASQRILLNGDSAFNELPGLPAQDLADHYIWTWYDHYNPGARDWVLAVNPSATETVTVRISFNNRVDGQNVDAVFDVAPTQSITPQFPGKMGGPVEVKAWIKDGDWENVADRRPIIASQRSLWGSSLEEVTGTPAGGQLPDTYHWTWYDHLSANMLNWVLVANVSGQPVYYEIDIPGVDKDVWPGAKGTIQPGQSAIPTFAGKMGGPVEVRAWTDSSKTQAAGVIASQRVLWNGYFNEVQGTELN